MQGFFVFVNLHELSDGRGTSPIKTISDTWFPGTKAIDLGLLQKKITVWKNLLYLEKMICKIGNLDVACRLENRGGGIAFMQKALNWHDFYGGGAARLSSVVLTH